MADGLPGLRSRMGVVMGCVSKGGDSGTDGGQTATVSLLSVSTNG